MGKGNQKAGSNRRSDIVLLSSDDDYTESSKYIEDSPQRPSRSLKRKPLSLVGSSHAARSDSKKPVAKKARCLITQSAPAKKINELDEFELFCKDFTEDFAEFKVSAGFRSPAGIESWVEKYRPHSLGELAVNKKKVEEIKSWFEDELRLPKSQLKNHALLITGPTGVGKSAAVRVVASHFGADVFEWNTPTPTIWQEHVHNSNFGMCYISKLDEFESFVERVRNYGLLPSSSSGSTSSPVILLIDDLPSFNGKIACRRLFKCLQLLVQSVQIPTVIAVTDYGRSDSGDAKSFCSEDLWLYLENTGTCKVAFNPITANSIKKVLGRICKQELSNVTPGQIDLVANSSEGDIRHAITSLQYLSLKSPPCALMSSSKGSQSCSVKNTHSYSSSEGFMLSFGRDQTLSLFHALGKFLHNKRDNEGMSLLSRSMFPLKERFTRLPLKMDEPEKVLCQAYGQARPVTEFLHENVLDFIDDEAMEDAWVVASYLSDADCLLSSFQRTFVRSYEAENIAQSAAASVSVRGVLFGNAHPSPSRWHTIRRPKIWQVEQSARVNKFEIERMKSDLHGSSISETSVISTEYRPVLKYIGHRATTILSPSRVRRSDCMISKEEENEEATDDEIEDW